MTSRIGIIGTGAVGGFYGGLLAKSGRDVHFLLRSDYDYVKTSGLKVDSPLGDYQISNVNAYNDPREMPKCDVIILSFKTIENGIARSIVEKLAHSESNLIVLQNGLDIEADFLGCVDPERLFGGVCFLCSNKVGPGHIRHLDYGGIALGNYLNRGQSQTSGRVSGLEKLAKLFEGTQIDLRTVVDLRHTRWSKLLWNIAFNGLSVALNATTSELVKHSHTASLCRSLMEEVRSIAAADDCPLDADLVEKNMQQTINMVPYESSMKLDFRYHRPLELEALYARPLNIAQRFKVPAAGITSLYQQLTFLNDRNLRAEA